MILHFDPRFSGSNPINDMLFFLLFISLLMWAYYYCCISLKMLKNGLPQKKVQINWSFKSISIEMCMCLIVTIFEKKNDRMKDLIIISTLAHNKIFIRLYIRKRKIIKYIFLIKIYTLIINSSPLFLCRNLIG